VLLFGVARHALLEQDTAHRADPDDHQGQQDDQGYSQHHTLLTTDADRRVSRHHNRFLVDTVEVNTCRKRRSPPAL
jgi:hypothetical protein